MPDTPPPAPVITHDIASFTPGIEWRHFLRLVLPLAILSGIVTATLPPLGFLVVFPATTILSISRYRQRSTRPLLRGQGARMGALAAVLGFGFFFATTALMWRTLRPLIVKQLLEMATSQPDPQMRQLTQWLATPEGLPVFLAVSLGLILVVFLLIGLASGALAARLGQNQPRF
jgi:hypothetical protein